MTIKTIIFDLGNVVVKHNNNLLYERLSKYSNFDAVQIKDRLEGDFLNRMDEGKYSPEEFFEKTFNLLNLEMNYEKFKEVWSSHFSRNPQMEELIDSLKGSYELMILSNTNELHYSYLEENYPILNKFDFRVLSFEVGIRKPNEKIYRKALETTKSKPEECIFTDDIKEYVEAAEQLDIEGILFKNMEEFKGRLKELGIQL